MPATGKRKARPSAAAEHAAEQAGKTAGSIFEVNKQEDRLLNAMYNFLSLGLSDYAEDLTPTDHEYAITLALHEAATNPKPHGDHNSLSLEKGTHLAKLWDCVGFTPGKETKDTDIFILWARICQAHREQVAGRRGLASAAEQGIVGSLPSWRGGIELSVDENKECFKAQIKYIFANELTEAQRTKPHFQWDPNGEKGPSRRARSVHDVILRNRLGHKNAAHHNYQHGLPRLVDAPTPRLALAATVASLAV